MENLQKGVAFYLFPKVVNRKFAVESLTQAILSLFLSFNHPQYLSHNERYIIFIIFS